MPSRWASHSFLVVCTVMTGFLRPAAAFEKSCVQWDRAGLPCPIHFRPSSFTPCAPNAVACQTLVDPSTQYVAQQGFTAQTWPTLGRASNQNLKITCGANVRNTFANVGCSTTSTALLAQECPELDFDGVHTGVPGLSTSSAALTGGTNNEFTLTVDTTGLSAGAHRLCIDLDGTGTLAKLNDAGLVVTLA